MLLLQNRPYVNLSIHQYFKEINPGSQILCYGIQVIFFHARGLLLVGKFADETANGIVHNHTNVCTGHQFNFYRSIMIKRVWINLDFKCGRWKIMDRNGSIENGGA